jgi:hypothetical protein
LFKEVQRRLSEAPKPETPEQAERFEKYHGHAVGRGLCSRCASQHAYGRQYGFAQVNAPCAVCVQVMAAWPTDVGNGWRYWASYRRGGSRRTQTPAVARTPVADAPLRLPAPVLDAA